MSNQRDMSKSQFAAACKRRDFRPQGFLGYFSLPASGHNLHVLAENAGPRRRAQLAYLISENSKAERMDD